MGRALVAGEAMGIFGSSPGVRGRGEFGSWWSSVWPSSSRGGTAEPIVKLTIGQLVRRSWTSIVEWLETHAPTSAAALRGQFRGGAVVGQKTTGGSGRRSWWPGYG